MKRFNKFLKGEIDMQGNKINKAMSVDQIGSKSA